MVAKGKSILLLTLLLITFCLSVVAAPVALLAENTPGQADEEVPSNTEDDKQKTGSEHEIYLPENNVICDREATVGHLTLYLPGDWEAVAEETGDIYERTIFADPETRDDKDAAVLYLQVDRYDYEALNLSGDFPEEAEEYGLDETQNKYLEEAKEFCGLQEFDNLASFIGLKYNVKALKYTGEQKEKGERIKIHGGMFFDDNILFDIRVVGASELSFQALNIWNKVFASLNSATLMEDGIDPAVDPGLADDYRTVFDMLPEEELDAHIDITTEICRKPGMGLKITLRNNNAVTVQVRYQATFYHKGKELEDEAVTSARVFPFVRLAAGESRSFAITTAESADDYEIDFEFYHFIPDFPDRVKMDIEVSEANGELTVSGQNGEEGATLPVIDFFFYRKRKLVYCYTLSLVDFGGVINLRPEEVFEAAFEVPVDYDDYRFDYWNMADY